MNRLRYLNKTIKAVTFDVTGTLLHHPRPIAQSYLESAQWARLKDCPTEAEFKVAFKSAYKATLLEYPFFRHPRNQWWKRMLELALQHTGRNYSQEDFERFYLRTYQYYGSHEAYAVYDEVVPLLQFLRRANCVLGVVSNTPVRTIESTLPMLGLHKHFDFFVSAQGFGGFKPDQPIFYDALRQSEFWHAEMTGDVAGIAPHCEILPEEVLHIGDSLEADFRGARACGFQAALLARSRSVQFNDWLVAPEAGSTSQQELQRHTYHSLADLRRDLHVEEVAWM